MRLGGICELVLETNEVERLASFYRELGLKPVLEEDGRVWLAIGECCRLGIWPPGDHEHSDRGGRSAYFFDPSGNRVELWDFFRDGDGAEDGVMALAEDGGDGS